MSRIFESPLALQRRSNLDTRDMWASMEKHRDRVMREIARAGQRGRLCVLGAGNCNDLELTSLVESFTEVHLVDLDAESLALGTERQGVREHPRLVLHGDVDFAGVTCELPGGAGSLEDAAVAFRRGVDVLPGDAVPWDCDVMVSACVLSQLARSAVERFGEDASGIHDLVTDVRNRHLDLLIDRTAPGGTVLLIADMVSSDSVPHLHACPDVGLAALRDQLVRAHNYFHGTNPYAIERYLTERHAPSLEPRFRPPPWRWHIGTRAFLVNAIRMNRASPVQSSENGSRGALEQHPAS